MKVMIFCSFLFFSLISNTYSIVYYVSSNGNDDNPGITQLLPWQTISKVNSMMALLLPGDQILFRRGDTFYGTINVSKSGAAGSEIVFGSYDAGDLPIITGKKLITGWTLYSGNIYRASFSDSVTHIYIGGKLMTIARYPNSGFLKLDAANGNTGFYDAALNQSAGYWNGANCRLRTANWCYETKTVSNFSGGNITFPSATQYSIKVNYGYYLDNKLDLLDMQNEWYQDKTTGHVYLFAPGGINPNSLQIEAVVIRDGIFVNPSRHYIKIENLDFNGYADNGVKAGSNNNNITITGCNITQTTTNGIILNGSNAIILNNYLEDNLNNAIYSISTNSQIKNNNINRTGLYPGYGTNGRGYLGMNIHISVGLTVENNIIDSTGYSAMSVGKNIIVKNNFINHSLLITNDGAGIDIANSDSMKILGNVILNTIGNTESSSNPALYGSGIYINGAVMKNSLIQNNTCAFNTYSGIYYDHKNTPENNIIMGNVLYNNINMQMLFADYSAVSFIPSYNTIVKNNIMYSLSANQPCLELRGHSASGISDYGNFDSNYYCNPYSEFSIRRTRFLPTFTSNVYTLADYKNTFGKDLNSNSLPFSFDQFGVTDTLSANMLTNSNFTTSINPWGGWPAGVTLGWTTHPLLDTGCLRIRWNGIGNSIGLTLSNRYPVTTGSHYLVSVSSVGNHSGTFSLWGLSSLSPSTFTFPQTFFNFDNYRKDYSLIYKADVTDPLAYMGIGLSLPDSLMYIDNIKMFEVNVDRIDSTQKSKMFVNENNFVKNIPLNGITYKDLDGNLVTGSITLQPYSSRILINDNFIPSSNLNLSALIEGLYNPASNKMIPDSMTVYIRSAVSPYSIIDTDISILDSNGNGTFNFTNVVNSTNYYISVKQRNSIETWSSGTVSFISDQLSYDFTTASNKAYGNNLKLKGSRYCIYSGEIIHDGEIEMWDFINGFNAVSNFSAGYVVEDLNGDHNVDLDDLNIVHNNSAAFVKVKKP